jgi:hypothetical protein
LTPEPVSVDPFQWTSTSVQLIGVAASADGTDGGSVSACAVVALATFEYMDAPFREKTRTR